MKPDALDKFLNIDTVLNVILDAVHQGVGGDFRIGVHGNGEVRALLGRKLRIGVSTVRPMVANILVRQQK